MWRRGQKITNMADGNVESRRCGESEFYDFIYILGNSSFQVKLNGLSLRSRVAIHVYSRKHNTLTTCDVVASFTAHAKHLSYMKAVHTGNHIQVAYICKCERQMRATKTI